MFKKLLVATAAMAVSATTFAGISLSGLYEGTLDSHGTYTQDIHTTMKGTAGASSVTVVLDKVKDSEDISAVTKTETMLKKDSFELNYSNSLNIKKFGLETLLHKKMESDRQFIKELEDEKSELLHMMYTQKQLFERVDRSKFSLKKINIFKNNKVLSISLSILLASYLVN